MSDVPAPESYLVGVEVIDATPPVGMRLTGFAARTEPSTGVYLPLRGVVTALTDRTSGERLILVSLEWLGFYDQTERARALIVAATGVPGDHVMLCGTHTHCGPPIHSHVPGDCWEEPDDAFLQATFERLAAAAQRALAKQEPMTLQAVTGRCGFAHSRRRPDGKGGVEWMPTLEAIHDHSVPVLVCRDATRRIRHVIFSYACHPTGGGPKLEFGGDYVGFALLELGKALGCTAAFLLGCAGDQKPYKTDPASPGFPAYSIEALHEFGRELATSVQRAIEQDRTVPVTGPMRVQSRRLTLHTTVLPREEYAAMQNHELSWFRRWAEINLGYLDRGARPPTGLGFELQTVIFGRSLALIAMSGEMSAEYGLRLVRDFTPRFSQVWPMAYANEILGYVPAERQIPEGGYEVIGSMRFLGKTGPLESGTEAKIFREVSAMLEKE
ncbi:MAG TPA: hypothetical protein PLU52_05850 [Opitutaceae bacterium]|nr:hypothetical protein [Opitutaceae bacterium]HND61943.1 hypothetical protein [Opitutaceae bacterium]